MAMIPGDEREKRRRELLAEIAKRFRESANTLREVARRIHEAARLQEENQRRLGAADKGLRECLASDDSGMPFTYLEFIEFSNAEEFRKFKRMGVITAEEIAKIDWDDLLRRLVDG
ncbi:MAG: hypothetical protein N3A66_03545 [Planctomycetota bacterium]|nr:hypothetical protein [Planctomycetota bacterium]